MTNYCRCGCGELALNTGLRTGFARGHHMRTWAPYPFTMSMDGCLLLAHEQMRRVSFRYRRSIYIAQRNEPPADSTPLVICGKPMCVHPDHVRWLVGDELVWSKVDKRGPDECWPWMASKNRLGYGNIGNRGTPMAHRVVFRIVNGFLPEVVMHRCDNRACCNPRHLVAGTHLENVRDMDSKGRRGVARGDRNGRRLHPESWPSGEQWSHAKLTEESVKYIRQQMLNRQRGTIRKLARQFNVAETTIVDVDRRRSWKSVA